MNDDIGTVEIAIERIPAGGETNSAEDRAEEISDRASLFAAGAPMPRLARLDAQVLFRLTRRRAQFGIIQ
jgi:hypothetical protein